MYEKQGFYAGEKLKASQLDAMEDGIINAERLAMEGIASAANMEKGTGENATQQIPRADKVTQAEGEEILHFNFAGHPDAGMTGRIPYGAIGNYSASINGRSAALSKHAFAINNSTIAKGEESFAQGYETIAEGNSSFAGGTRTWAKGAASVALGDRTKALGEYSFANGVHTVAGYAYQTVIGAANDNDAESLFEVGNGKLDVDGNIVERSTAFRVMRNGKVKIKDIWAKEDDDVIALGFLNYRLNEELLPQLEEDINAELDTFRPYLVLTSNREDKTSVQMAACAANGAHSVAFGHGAKAVSAYTCAIGKDVNAGGDHSIAMGVNSGTSAIAAFAVGVHAHASGSHSYALGTNVNAGYVYQTVIGKNNANKEGTLFEVGNGADTDNRSNAFEVYTDGLVVVGNKVQQMPDGVANGFDFTGKNPYATAIDGTLTGTIPYGATGDFASAFGGKCAAQGKRSHAEGTTTIAKGAYSHAEGNSTVTLGNNAHAEGLQTLAKGDHSHSEGQLTQAIGERSHAEGNDTIAKGNNSHVGGWKSETNGAYSFAHGAGVIADVACQVVFGRYNLRTQSAFIVGSGSQEEKRNSFEVRQNGDICMYYNGKMYSLQKIFIELGMFKSSTEIDLSNEVTE